MVVVEVAALPKADLHLHAETDGRVDRLLARREGRAAFDWAAWGGQLQRDTPPGFPRLEAWWGHAALPSADWAGVARWTARAAAVGLGITVHAGEFSRANIEAACALPGVSRIGHAVYAAADPRLLLTVQRAGVTIECCLSCNVLLGAVASFEEHPIRAFAEHGIPVTLNSDDPVRVCTTIGREYEIAASVLGFSEPDLVQVTRNAIQASFTSPARRAALLSELDLARGLQ